MTTCGHRLLIQKAPGIEKDRIFVCQNEHAPYGRYSIIEHRQGLFQWHEHALTMVQLATLAMLQDAIDAGVAAGRPNTRVRLDRDALESDRATLDLLVSYKYLQMDRPYMYTSTAALYAVTFAGREVVRLRRSFISGPGWQVVPPGE